MTEWRDEPIDDDDGDDGDNDLDGGVRSRMAAIVAKVSTVVN